MTSVEIFILTVHRYNTNWEPWKTFELLIENRRAIFVIPNILIHAVVLVCVEVLQLFCSLINVLWMLRCDVLCIHVALVCKQKIWLSVLVFDFCRWSNAFALHFRFNMDYGCHLCTLSKYCTFVFWKAVVMYWVLGCYALLQ